MRRLSFAALATVLGLASLSRPRAAYAYQGGALANHAHSSVAGQGGATISPNSVTASTVQVNGGRLKISSGAFILDGAGASFTLPASSLNGASIIKASSFTIMATGAASISATILSVCVPGSTVTVTTNGAPLDFRATVPYNPAVGQNVMFGVLVDGAFLDGQTNALGLFSARETANITGTAVINHRFIATISAASHAFCLTAAIDGSSMNLNCGVGTIGSMCQVGVTE